MRARSDSTFDQRPETARGRALFEALLATHAQIRQALASIQQLATQVANGLDATELREQLHELKRGSVLWRLQVNCLRYCRFVHAHHNAEDADFFAELRATNPAINPIIDRLETDHLRVSDDLDAVEATANALHADDGQGARQAVVDALGALEANLLTHLEYEEQNIQTTVRRMRDW